MVIEVTLRNLSDKCWDKACEMLGLDYYCLNEGADPDTRYKLNEDQAKELGFI